MTVDEVEEVVSFAGITTVRRCGLVVGVVIIVIRLKHHVRERGCRIVRRLSACERDRMVVVEVRERNHAYTGVTAV